MRMQGFNVAAIAAAAVAVYFVGFLVYGVFFSEYWQGLVGFNEADYAGLEWRMALSPAMPILVAIGTAVALRWRGASGVSAGLATGALLWLFFTGMSRLYGFVYGSEPAALLVLDQAHLLAGHLVAGAILGAWR